MSSSYILDIMGIVPIMHQLAQMKSPVSQAAGAAVQLNNAAHSVKTDGAIFAGLEQDAIQLLFLAVENLREKRQRNLDDNTRDNLNALIGVMGKITELAQKNSAMSDENASSHSDQDELQSIRRELEQLLPAFDVTSFTDLRTKAVGRVKSTNDEMMNVENQGGGKRVVTFGQGQRESDGDNNYGVLGAAGNPEFPHVPGEYTSGDYSRVRYRGQNVALNYGRVFGQNIGDNATFFFENLPPPQE